MLGDSAGCACKAEGSKGEDFKAEPWKQWVEFVEKYREIRRYLSGNHIVGYDHRNTGGRSIAHLFQEPLELSSGSRGSENCTGYRSDTTSCSAKQLDANDHLYLERS